MVEISGRRVMEEARLRERIIEILESIDARLARLENRIGEFVKEPRQEARPIKAPLDVDALLSLPDHLRKTAMAVSATGSTTAEEVSKTTGRTRAAESDYLNQLVKMGYMTKERKGRTIYFHV